MPVYEAESQERRAESREQRAESSPANAEPEMQVLDTVKLGALMVKSLRGLAAEVGRCQARESAARTEARKLLQIAALCGGVIPDDVAAVFGSKPKRGPVVSSEGNSLEPGEKLVCPDCGARCKGNGGLAIHHARAHSDKAWDSSGNLKPKAAPVE